MSGTIALDLTDDGTRFMYTLLVRIRDLSIAVTTGMRFRVSPLTMAQMDGFTAKRTNKGALIDCLTVATAMREDYEVPSYLIPHLAADEKKQQALLRKIKRDAAKWRTEGRPQG